MAAPTMSRYLVVVMTIRYFYFLPFLPIFASF
nr:MAG TPA: hypothetical protein [Caudoviricetes sp.]